MTRLRTPSIIAVTLALFVGCASPKRGNGHSVEVDSGQVIASKGPAYRHQTEFREELLKASLYEIWDTGLRT